MEEEEASEDRSNSDEDEIEIEVGSFEYGRSVGSEEQSHELRRHMHPRSQYQVSEQGRLDSLESQLFSPEA